MTATQPITTATQPMTTQNTEWTFEEFRAYLLLFCAYTNYTETDEERMLIRKFTDAESFERIYEEFSRDNDYQSIQKILGTVDRLDLDRENIDELLKQAVQLFNADGVYDILERNMFRNLKRLFS